jgi:hypothetical protein
MTSLRLWGILVIALALRVALTLPLMAAPATAFAPDSWEYLYLAAGVQRMGSFEPEDPAGYANIPVRPGGAISASPDIFRTPGYPVFLACIGAGGSVCVSTDPSYLLMSAFSNSTALRLFGQAVVAVQVLIDLHLVLLTYLLGRRLVGHGVGLLAALFQAISPLAVASSCRILSDGVFAFLLTAALLLMLRHFRTGGSWPLVLAAGGMGVACYVRPVGLAMAGAMALVLLLRAKRVRRTAAFAVVVSAVLAPWVARNATVADYLGFSCFATDSMYWYSAAEVVAREKRIPVEGVRKEFRRQEGWELFEGDGEPVPRDMTLRQRIVSPDARFDSPCCDTPGGLARYRWQRAREIILAHPWAYMGIHLKGCMAFWLPGATDVLEIAGLTTGGKGTLDVLHRQGLWAAVRHYFGDNTKAMWLAGAMLLVPLVRYAGVLMLVLGKLRMPRRRGGHGDRHRIGEQRAVSEPVPISQAGGQSGMGAEVGLCLLLVLLAFLLPGPAAHPRFRVPVEPILSVAAAAGWAMLAARWRARTGKGEGEPHCKR